MQSDESFLDFGMNKTLLNNKSITCTLCCKCLGSLADLYCKMPMFWRAGMREGGKPLPLAFQYLILMI